MKKNIFIIGSCFLILSACAPDRIICDGRVVIHAKGRIKFSKNEKPLLCGDPDVKEWKHVPLAQTEITLKEFLRDRGYYNSKFELKDEHLHVYTGKRYKVKKVIFIDAPKDFDKLRYIGWNDQDFTPDTLNDIEAYTLRRLKELGYACAEIKLQAIIETQIVQVHINPGIRYDFPEITYNSEPSVKPEVLERYFAFHPGELFNEDLLMLSSRRIESDAVVSNSNFLTTCENDKLTINHRVSSGTSRLFKIAAGASTEEIPIVRIGWKDSKIGNNASISSADLYASHLRQELSLAYEWHSFDANRWFFKPTLEFKRIDEDDQKYYTAIGWIPLGAKLDYRSVHFEFETGPAGDFEDVQFGPTTGRKEFGIWRSSLSLNTQNYEVFLNEPRRGMRFSVQTSSVAVSSVRNVNAHWLSVSGTKLWNLFNFGPPKYVFGIRFGGQSVLTTKDYDISDFIPQNFFTWMGGDNDLRGFHRRELPRDALGALSSFYADTEVRFASLFIKNVDPFIFTDLGLIGDSNFHLSGPLYWSPGIGLRWQSIIGVFRGTMAHGFIAGENDSEHEHFQFFLSLGREF